MSSPLRRSWGGYPRVVSAPTVPLTSAFQFEGLQAPYLVRGMGRSYGDVGLLEQGTLIEGSAYQTILGFDTNSGILRCTAGVTLEAILEYAIPLGWTLPVIPGTRFVTVGGAIANDIHGKNHHRQGTFGCHVHSFRLLRSDGVVHECSLEHDEGLFRATIGGLGLTGVILDVELVLMPVKSAWMQTRSIRTSNLAETLTALSNADREWDYTVAWIDLLCGREQRGRAFVSCGRHAEDPSLPPIAPVFTPARLGSFTKFGSPFLQRWLVALGNTVRYRLHRQPVIDGHAGYQSFFHPLDVIDRWNEAYGPRGFLQYQCVVPMEGGEQTLNAIFDILDTYRIPVFLAVLKIFGPQTSPGLLSFPRQGYTVALDVPFRGENTLRALDACDEIVMGVSGRVYPAKDARMSPSTFRAMYPELSTFISLKDPLMSSSFWKRMSGDQR